MGDFAVVLDGMSAEDFKGVLMLISNYLMDLIRGDCDGHVVLPKCSS
jgi:hypothetical protein